MSEKEGGAQQPDPCAANGGSEPGVCEAAWTGEYFANAQLAGPPAFVRQDDAIWFNWGDGSPGEGLGADEFSVRWTRWVYLPRGRYTFRTLTDDGVRMWIDSRKILDRWQVMSPTEQTVSRFVPAGFHRLQVEYYEAAGSAMATLDWTCEGECSDAWTTRLWSNPELSGDPAVLRRDEQIDFDWGMGAPADGLPADFFSARFWRTTHLVGGTYLFTTTSDDGVRLWLDGELVMDEWRQMASTEHRTQQDILTGEHTIVLDYFELDGAASAKLSIERLGSVEPPITGWRAEYFANGALSGPPAVVRDEGALDFDWGTGSPAAGIPTEGFSARFTRDVEVHGDVQEIMVAADDGVRVLVDGATVIDAWYVQAHGISSTRLRLAPGKHRVVIEYFENVGLASLSLAWNTFQDPLPEVGNLTLCAPRNPPYYAWARVLRWEPNENRWIDLDPHGFPNFVDERFFGVQGLRSDFFAYGSQGHPYYVELYWDDPNDPGDDPMRPKHGSEVRVVAGRDNQLPPEWDAWCREW